MKHQPWDLNQTWPVGREWYRFTNAPQNFGPLLPSLRRKNIKFFTTSTISALDAAYLWNETWHKQTKTLVSIYNVSPKSWPTLTQKRLRSVCSLWPTLRRPLRCNHHSCDMSSVVLYWVNLFADLCLGRSVGWYTRVHSRFLNVRYVLCLTIIQCF